MYWAESMAMQHCKISDIPSGNGVTMEEHEWVLNRSDLTLFKYAP
jgi:hypothetical protein